MAVSSHVDICCVLCCYFYSLGVDLSAGNSVPAGEARQCGIWEGVPEDCMGGGCGDRWHR